MRSTFILIILLLSSFFLSSCGTYNALFHKNRMVPGITTYDEVNLPKEKRGEFSFNTLLMDVISVITVVGVINIPVDIYTGRLFYEKNYVSTKKNITVKDIKESDYAYVVISTNIDNSNTQWTNISKKYDDYKNSLYDMFVVYGNEPYLIYKINPGKYTLTGSTIETIRYSNGISYRFLPESIRNKNEKDKNTTPLLASFEVEKGKLYYLGDVHLEKGKVVISDLYTEDLSVLKKKYKKLFKDEDIMEKNIITPGIMGVNGF